MTQSQSNQQNFVKVRIMQPVEDLIEQILIVFSILDDKKHTTESEAADRFLDLVKDETPLKTLLKNLFPTGIPTDGSFYEHLEEFRPWIGFSESANQAIAFLWVGAINELEENARQKLLDAFVDPQGHFLFGVIDCLKHFFSAIHLQNDLLESWLVKILLRIGNDVQNGLWSGVRALCRMRPSDMLEIARSSSAALLPIHLELASRILGILRSMEVPDDLRRQRIEFEGDLSNENDQRLRQCAQQSWVTTAFELGISQTEFEGLIQQSEKHGKEDVEALARIFSSVLLSDKTDALVLQKIFEWVTEHASPTVLPITKRQLAAVAIFVRRTDKPFDTSSWLIKIQPVDASEERIWDDTISFLAAIAKTSPKEFKTLFRQLAEINSKSLLTAIKSPQTFGRLQTELMPGTHADVVGELMMSSVTSSRRLGLYLFDKLNQENIPIEVLEAKGMTGLKLLFHEAQRTPLGPRAIARVLIIVSQQADSTDANFALALNDEIALQARNFSGKCLTELRRLGGSLPNVEKLLAEVDQWFEDLNRARSSGICSMEVPGTRRAINLYRRKMTQLVSKSTEEHSVMWKMMKKVQLPYGGHTSHYIDGKLSPARALLSHSEGIEVPFLETMDPEELAMRRIHALASIEDITHQAEEPENPENDG